MNPLLGDGGAGSRLHQASTDDAKMGQRKLGQHTKAVFYKNVSQQRTKKGTNLCLVLSPLILCGLLFGLQLAINFLFLDRPEFRCGCKCVDCCVTTSDGNEECYVDRPDICLVADRCTRRDTSECTIAYSTPQQFGFCEIKTPYRWPSQLQLPQSVLEAPESWRWDHVTKARTLVTGETEALAELSSRLVEPLSEEPAPFAKLIEYTNLIARVAENQGEIGEHPDHVYTDDQSLLEGSNLLTYALFSNPEIMENLTEAEVVFATPHHNERPVFFFDGAFSIPRMLHYLQRNCSALRNATSIEEEEHNHCAELELVSTADRKEMNERQYCGFEKSAITQEVDCTGKGYAMVDYATAWDFGSSTKTKFDLKVSYNDTNLNREARDQGPDWQNRATEQVSMATQAFVKWVLGDEYSVRLRALRDMPREKKGLSLDFASLLGPAFYVLLFQLPAPAMLVMLVQEKENKILMRMKMQGMSPMAHYWGFYLWNLAIFVIFTIITLISGIAIYQLKFFTLSDIGLLLVFVLLYGNMQVSQDDGVELGRQNYSAMP